jgi:hypothetical protein
MNSIRILTCLLGVVFTLGTAAAQAETVLLKAKPGSKVQIDGTSTVHDWTVEGKLIGGSVTVGEDFPLEAGASVAPGTLEAVVNAFIPITSLKSVKNGKPYSEKMDEIMHEKLGSEPMVCDATGHLVVAGVTNAIQLPVEITPLGDGKVKFSTRTSVKMTDYGIDPPAPKIALGMIKTGDEVEVSIEWMTAQAVAK